MAVLSSSCLLPVHSAALAAGEPEAQFRPVKAWEVSSKGSDAASRECLIQNEFNNGFLVQFNGSSNWVQSLNINFRQNVFESGKSYAAQLSVPGRSAVAAQAGSLKANILSIPVKTQKELYKDIRQAGVLDLDVEGNAFRFYMSGFSDAAAEFEKCMAGQAVVAETPMVKAAVPAPAPVAAAPVSSGDEIVVRLSDAEKEAAINSGAGSDFTVNESIALEQQEAGLVNVQEIIPPPPAPAITEVAQDLAPKRAPVEAVPEPAPEPMMPEAVAVGDAPVIEHSEAARPLAKMPKGNQSHLRLSDQLAEQLETNPDLAAIDNVPVIPKEPVERVSAPVSDEAFSGADAVVERPDARPQGLEIPEEILEARTVAPAVRPAPEPAPTPAPEEAPVAKIAAAPPPVPAAKPVAVTPAPKPVSGVLSLSPNVKLPADAPDIVKQMAAQNQIGQNVASGAQSPARIEAAAVTPMDLAAEPVSAAPVPPVSSEDIVVKIVDEPREATPILPEPAQSGADEPMVVKFDDEPSPADATPPKAKGDKADDIVIELAPEPTVPEAVPPGGTSKTQSYKSPEPKITRETTSGEADFTSLGPAAGQKNDIRSTADLARVASLEKQIDELRAENAALNDELNVSLREGEKERISISSENWNLERATMLYNEAERQNKSLGMQIQKERAQHAMEKKELEAMLFDPEVTSQEQLAKLADLERELAAAKARLKAIEVQKATP